MKLRWVDPRKISVPDVRVTSVFDSELLQEFKNSIKELGILEPPVCVDDGENLYIVDGLHRVIEAIEAKTKQIQVAVVEGTIKDVLIQNLSLNNLRGKINPTDTARVLKVLFDEQGMGVDEISKKTGFSEDRISKLLYISRAVPGVLSALDDGLIQLGHAFLLSKIEDRDVQDRVLAQQLIYHFKVSDLAQHIENVNAEKEHRENMPPPEASYIPQELKCSFCGEEYPINQLANPNTCPVCSGILIDSIRQARAYQARATEP